MLCSATESAGRGTACEEVRQLITQAAEYHFADQDYKGVPTFSHLNVVWREGNIIHHCKLVTRDPCDDLDSLVSDSSIDVNAFRPRLPANLVPLAHPLPSNSYVKSVGVCRGGVSPEEAAFTASVALKEVLLWETTLRHHPHPHIVEYRGVVSEGGEHITGIVFERCEGELADARTEVEAPKVMEEIRSAVAHLHSLDFVHGDISNRNVMLDSKGSAILIDFDSCVQEGGERSGGTPGFMRQTDDRVARKEQDLYSLECLESWLATGRTKVGSQELQE